MTPNLIIRSFTNDQYILDKVFYSNCYRMRAFKEHERRPVVVDIGAHAGYFTFNALALGAKKVYAFEPLIDNFKILLKNVGDTSIGPVVPYLFGVYVTNMTISLLRPQLINGTYFDFANIDVSGASPSPEFSQCYAMTLDKLLSDYVCEQVDLLKISIGPFPQGSIISQSEKIKTDVANICGEVILENEEHVEMEKQLLKNRGFNNISIEKVKGEEKVYMFMASKTELKEMFV